MMTAPARWGFSLAALLDGYADVSHLSDIQIVGLTLDSRTVQAGDLFFALVGTRQHGMNYVEKAIDGGAAAIVYDPLEGGQQLVECLEVDSTIPFIRIEHLHQMLGFIASRFFEQPSEHLDVIGITGTNGKTSCSHFLAQALSGHQSCTVMGTLGWGFPGHLKTTSHTTPDPIALHAAIAAMQQQGAKCLAMEVSSHGLVQGRVLGVHFRGAVYTNISRDHLDYHQNLGAYLDAKLRLLQLPGLQFVVINLDDSTAQKILATVPDGIKVLGFSRRHDHGLAVPQITASKVKHNDTGLSFEVNFQGHIEPVSVPLFGDFNVENVLVTLAVLLEMGVALADAVQRVGQIKPVPGRMERFVSGINAPTVVVDYAHTPHALESVLKSLRIHCRGKLWLVFGCGGNRDRGKRAQMGRIAEQFADQIIVTDDNPRDEDGAEIVSDILAGCQNSGLSVIRDRLRAITLSVEQAEPRDLIIVAGKGHENTQEVGGVKRPFSDRKAVSEALLKRSGSTRASSI